MIKEGAKLVEGPEDILEELGPALKRYSQDIDIEPKLERSLEPVSDEKHILPRLNEEEQKIYDSLTEEPIHIDEVVGKTNFPPSLVLSTLTRLEIRKLAKELPGKMFVKMST